MERKAICVPFTESDARQTSSSSYCLLKPCKSATVAPWQRLTGSCWDKRVTDHRRVGGICPENNITWQCLWRIHLAAHTAVLKQQTVSVTSAELQLTNKHTVGWRGQGLPQNWTNCQSIKHHIHYCQLYPFLAVNCLCFSLTFWEIRLFAFLPEVRWEDWLSISSLCVQWRWKMSLGWLITKWKQAETALRLHDNTFRFNMYSEKHITFIDFRGHILSKC